MPTTFDADSHRFNYRVAGVALRGDEVLLHKAQGDDFWTLPGGRPELGEPSALALQRELHEELNVAAEVHRLLWIAENFFHYEGRDWHELLLIFLCRLPADSFPMQTDSPFPAEDAGRPLWFEWFKISALDRLIFYPTFLTAGLRNLPDAPLHFVDTDERMNAEQCGMQNEKCEVQNTK